MSSLDSVRTSLPTAGSFVAALSRGPSAPERAAAAWFNDSMLEGSRVLRAPSSSSSGASPQQLTERFLASLCGS